MIKDAYEDYKRHKEDHEENSAMCNVYQSESGSFVPTQWKHVKVGDVVRVQEDKFFPADMVVLQSSAPEGALYVETKNLDGETNLKLKSVAKDLVEPFVDDGVWKNLSGVLNIEQPNNRIYKFDGNFELVG